MAATSLGKIQKRISDNLAILTARVKNRGATGCTDINHEAEDLYCGLLNTAFGWNLINQNRIAMNFPAIDLADLEATLEDGRKGIAVQVTSTKTHAKIQRTLDKFFRYRHHEHFSRLIILIIGEKQDYRKKFTLNEPFSFDKAKDIWSTEDLIRQILALPEAVQKKVDRYLQMQHPISDTFSDFTEATPAPAACRDGMIALEQMLVTEHFDFTEIIRSKKQNFVGRRAILSQIETWEKEKSGKHVLLLIGSAGMGKTALCAELGHIIHICSFDQEATTYSRNILGSLAYQLSQWSKDYAEILSSSEEIGHLRNKNSIELFMLFFVDTLKQIPKPEQPVVVIVDALDEISPCERNDFLVALSSKESQLPDWIKIILTTRPDSGVKAFFPAAPIVDMDQDNESNRDDCRAYLEKHLNKHGIAYSPETLELAIDNSDGNFLYIHYLIEDTVTGAEKVLKASEFPPTIGAFYLNWLCRTFRDDPGAYRERMLPILQILCSAKSTLTIAELSQISGESEAAIMELIRKTRSIISRRPDHTVTFYHKSVKDWLCDPLTSTDYFVDSTMGSRVIVDYIRAEYDLTEMLPENGYITKYGGVHLIENTKADLFCKIYRSIPLEQRDEFCRAFSQVPAATLVRFLMAVKKDTAPISFWSLLSHVVSVCSDMEAYDISSALCLDLLTRVDNKLKVLLHANLCIAMSRSNKPADSLTHSGEMLSLYSGIQKDGSQEVAYVGSVAHNVAGYACRLEKQTKQAKEYHVSSIQMAELLLNDSYQTLQILAAQQVYHAYSNLSCLMVTCDPAQSLEYSRKKLGVARKLKEMSNEYRNQLNEVNAYNSLIECLFQNYRYFEAYALCEEAIPYAEEVVIHHTSIKSNHTLAVLYSLAGKAELKQNGDAKNCLTYYQKGFQLIEKNWRMLPSNQTKEALAKGYMKLGRFYLREQDPVTAILYMKQGIAILEHLQKLFPQRSYAKSLSDAYVFCARAYLDQKDYGSADKQVSAALEILLSMAFCDTQVYSDRCWCYHMKGEIAQKQGKLDEAFNYYTCFRDEAEIGCETNDSINAVIFVFFANMTLAFLKADLSEKETGKNYAIQAISALLGFYKIEPAQELILDAVEKMLAVSQFDLYHVTTILKEFFGKQFESMDAQEIRVLKNAFHSFSDYVNKSKG